MVLSLYHPAENNRNERKITIKECIMNTSKAQAIRRVAGIAVIAALSVAGILLTGCPDEGGGSQMVEVEMVQVAGGSFEMGNPSGGDGAGPVHTVTLGGFYMGKYPVTQEQYLAVTGSNPSSNSADPASGEVQGKRPADQVSWYDAIEFCNALSVKNGFSPYYTIDKVNEDPNNTNSGVLTDTLKWTVTRNSAATGYRLPTEAQWEYAAKGGNPNAAGWVGYTYSGSDKAGDVAWYFSNSNIRSREVGKKAPNGLGLYDMSGNVWEWCWDWYGSYASGSQADPLGAVSGDNRVIRGGSFYDPAEHVRSDNRYYYNPMYKTSSVGIRLVRPMKN